MQTDTVRPLTTRTRIALAIARGVAAARGDRDLTPTHIAVGIFREGANPALAALFNSGVEADFLRHAAAALEAALGEPTGHPSPRDIALDITPGEQAVLRTAEAEAAKLGDEFLGTEHIMLAILREPSSELSSFMASRQITAQSLAQGIIKTRSRGTPQ